MKAIVIKLKRINVKAVKTPRKCGIILKAAVLLGAIYLTAGTPLCVRAQEGSRAEGFIYHKHAGNPSEREGCYGKPVNHMHVGNMEAGGECYITPVYHEHAGDHEQGGACFNQKRYHVHEGEDSKEGGCYGPVYHSHGSGCYREETCTVSYNRGYTYETWAGDCYHHGKVYYGRAYAKEYHRGCGAGTRDTTVVYCPGCEPDNDRDTTHKYSKLSCGQENAVTGYCLACGKTDETVDSYEMDCTKTDSDTDSYTLSCEKTTETIDFYELSCGKNQDTPIGRIILDNLTSGIQDKVVLHAEFEDFSGGELKLGEETFIWKSKAESIIGTGDEIQVSKNGIYRAGLQVLNEDIDPDRLFAEIAVNNVKQPEEPSTGGGSQGGSSDTEDGNQTPEKPESTPSPVPKASAAPTPAFVATAEAVNTDNISKKTTPKTEKSMEKEVPTMAPRPTAKIYKETKQVMLQENAAPIETTETVKTLSPVRQFFESPAVRIITITLSSVIAVSGIILAGCLLMRSVKLYNEDGEDKLIYLGRCLVKLQEDGYQINISQGMIERSVTNQYIIRPGMFLYGKPEHAELIICKEEKKAAVYLCKEMLVVI